MADKHQAIAKRENGKGIIELEAEIDALKSQHDIAQANKILGGLYATHALNRMIGAQVMRGWERFFEEGLHLTLGYEGIDQFLNEAPEAPMTKHQWYDRKKLLEAEGDDTFDLLNSIRIPISTRKALPPSAFEVRENVLVVSDEKGNEYEVPLTDTKRVKSIINNIAREHGETKKKLSDETKKTEALSNRVKELSDAKPKPNAELTTPHGEALLFAVTALANLAEKAEELTDEEAIAYRKNATEAIAQVMTRLNTAYRFSLDKPLPAEPSTNGNGNRKHKLTAKDVQDSLGD